VLVAVTGPNLKCGWVQDYSEISAAVSPTIAKLDHQNLNEILPCHTTAENLAIWIVGEIQHLLPMLSRVEVRETPTSNVILEVRSGLMGKFQSPV
jgi:6-pyruvoyltetrahydropterin/6-carboxytetrahydropterin synthase